MNSKMNCVLIMKNKIYQLFQDNNIEIERDVFDYGFYIFMNYFLFTIVMIPVSLYLNILPEMIVFLITFIPLRRYLGGFHFNKAYLCFVFSLLFPVVFSLLSKYNLFNNLFIVIITITLILIYTYKNDVMDHPNKPISNSEKAIYKQKTLLLEAIYCLILFVMYYFSMYHLVNTVILSIIFSILCHFIAKLV